MPATRRTSRSVPGPRIEQLESRVLCAAVDSGPDLALTFASAVFGSFLGGEKARAAVAVHNLPSADAAAPRSAVGLYLSTDHLFDEADLLLTSASVRALKRGASVRVKVKPFTIPTGLAPGDYYVHARVDPADAVNEESETNNTASSPGVTIVAPFSDLVPVAITRVKLRRAAKLSGFFGTATLVVWNVGNVTYSGEVDLQGSGSRNGAVPPNADPIYLFTSTVFVPAGRSTKIKVRINASLAHQIYYRPDFVFTIVLDTPGDPTPRQSVSAIVRFPRR